MAHSSSSRVGWQRRPWMGRLAFAATASLIGCGSDTSYVGEPIQNFGPPPADIPPPAPANSATASTNASNYPVSAMDLPTCGNITAAVFEFWSPSIGAHLHAVDFEEGVNNGYGYEWPMNVLVKNVAGSEPLYRCAMASNSSFHFVSLDPNCEGQINDNLTLGYSYVTAQPNTSAWYRFHSGADHYLFASSKPPSAGLTLDGPIGYLPNLSCQSLATTCQPYPSEYLGYTVNPGPDPDAGIVAYGDNAPAPPWFGQYTAAGSNGNAILTGDWGTYNGINWDASGDKAECGYTDWMTGLSIAPGHFGAPHAFRCAMSEWALAGRTMSALGLGTNFNCRIWTQDFMGGSTGTGAGFAGDAPFFRNGSSDWDPGYTKHSCPPVSYLAGISGSQSNNDVYHASLCCEQPGLGSSDCTTVVYGQPSPEQNTSMSLDDAGVVSPLNWDPPTASGSYPLAECGAGRRMMGASTSSNGAIHAILCCATPTPSPAQASKSCCSPQTLQLALHNCNADHVNYLTDCDNIVAPCCASDPNSDGTGGVTCAANAETTNGDATTTSTGGPSVTPGTTASGGPSCGATGAPLAWSYSYKKSGGVGNNTFGASYEGDLTFSAGPIYATGEASVSANAALFGTKLNIALCDLRGSISAQPLTVDVKLLGSDIYVYPGKNSKQGNDAGSPPPSTPYDAGSDWKWPTPDAGAGAVNAYDSDSMTYTETFFTETEIIFLFGVPISIVGAVAGEIGLTVSAGSASDTLSFNATPWVGATATCTATLGGGKGRFRLSASLEGSLDLFTASLPTSAVITPYSNAVNYTLESDFMFASLDGTIKAALKASLRPGFHKTFKTTLAKWSGVTVTTHLFHYNGCANY